jgi:hypothetical protein
VAWLVAWLVDLLVVLLEVRLVALLVVLLGGLGGLPGLWQLPLGREHCVLLHPVYPVHPVHPVHPVQVTITLSVVSHCFLTASWLKGVFCRQLWIGEGVAEKVCKVKSLIRNLLFWLLFTCVFLFCVFFTCDPQEGVAGKVWAFLFSVLVTVSSQRPPSRNS